MKKIFLAVVILTLSGCATWDTKSDTEKKAWIIGGAVVIAAGLLSTQEDNFIVGQSNQPCFESVCGE